VPDCDFAKVVTMRSFMQVRYSVTARDSVRAGAGAPHMQTQFRFIPKFRRYDDRFLPLLYKIMRDSRVCTRFRSLEALIEVGERNGFVHVA